MDLFVEKPINRSKLECVLDQLQDLLGMQSSDCSSSEPLEPPASAQEPEWASCCGPLPVTDFMVSNLRPNQAICDYWRPFAALTVLITRLAPSHILPPAMKQVVGAPQCCPLRWQILDGL